MPLFVPVIKTSCIIAGFFFPLRLQIQVFKELCRLTHWFSMAHGGFIRYPQKHHSSNLHRVPRDSEVLALPPKRPDHQIEHSVA